MAFATNIEKQNVEKNALVILRPRQYLEDWTDDGGGVYSTTFTYGRVVRMWFQYGSGELTRKTELSGLGGGEFYHDYVNGILYVGAVAPPTNRTAEYELYLSQKYFMGPADPLDNSSDVVEWIPALQQEPTPKNGSRDTQYGFSPLFTSSVEVINSNGWLNEQMKRGSFLNALAKVYVMANGELEDGVLRGDVIETMVGYCADSLSGLRIVSIPVSDFFRVLNKAAEPPLRFVTTDFTGYVIQPDANVLFDEWYVRRVRGMLENFQPVNIDYSSPGAVDNNRIWITDEIEDGLDEGTITLVVDHLAANTATKTFFTTTPQLNVGDHFAMTNNGVTRYSKVYTIDRAAKWVTHADFTGRTVTSGDTMTRYYVGSVTIEDSNGIQHELRPGIDYLRFDGPSNGLGNVRGFVLADNWEAAHPFPFTDNGGIFDPTRHRIVCRLYGPKAGGEYSDSSTVGADVDEGGIDAKANSIVHWLLKWAGIEDDQIDEDGFDDMDADAHPIGIAIPATAAGTAENFSDYVLKVLQSMLWRLGFVQVGAEIKIGIIPTQPFQAGADYSADELDHKLVNYEQSFADIYYSARCQYGVREILLGSQAHDYKVGVCDRARDLHLVTREFPLTILQYVGDNAQTIAQRLAYLLGDRRAFYTIQLKQRYLARASLGVSYDLTRKQLPGFPYVPGTDRTSQLSVVEVQKSTAGPILVLEDQQGIQDNSGGW